MTSLENFTLPEWPYAFGKTPVKGILRSCPQDFEVEELSAVEPSGDGSHLWLWIEKTNANTDWVAKQLACVFNCPPRDVGYAGMKDRHAVTRQWFSLPWPVGKDKDVADPDIEGVQILHTVLHGKKIRRGVLRGNRFRIRIRQLHSGIQSAVMEQAAAVSADPPGGTDAKDSAVRAELEQRLVQIKQRGVPNYFGPQRFGFGGNNVTRAVHWLQQGGRLPRSKRSIYLSALRSYLFNLVLAKRVEAEIWDSLLEGDLAMLDGTHSIFACEPLDESLVVRCREFDLHPTGPMPGRAGVPTLLVAAELEASVLADYQGLVDALDAFGVQAERRSLRLKVNDLAWQFTADDLLLEFSLPPGAYATIVIRELVDTMEAGDET